MKKDNLFDLVQKEKLDEKEKLKIIEEYDLINQLSIDEINNEMIGTSKLNLLMYSLKTKQFEIASKIIAKEGILLDNCIDSINLTALDVATGFLVFSMKNKSLLNFFDVLCQQKRAYSKDLKYAFQALLMDAPNQKLVLNFINAFNLDLNQYPVFDYIEEREEFPLHSLKAILKTNHYSQEALEKILNNENYSFVSNSAFKKVLQDKIVELTQKEKKHLENFLKITTTKKTVTPPKVKI